MTSVDSPLITFLLGLVKILELLLLAQPQHRATLPLELVALNSIEMNEYLKHRLTDHKTPKRRKP